VTDLMTIEGLRSDGRTPGDLRNMTIKTNVIPSADGSVYMEWGNNKLYVTVNGPFEAQPRHLQDPHRATIQVNYSMSPFSCPDRKRPGPDRRAVEISKLLAESLSKVVIRERFPKTLIDVHIDIIEADAGTRCAGLTAASVAMAHAGIPMYDLVGAVSVGKVENIIILDPGKEEDSKGQADMPVGIIPSTGEVVLLQMDGQMNADEFNDALKMAREAISNQINKKQLDALKDSVRVVPFEEEDLPDEGGIY